MDIYNIGVAGYPLSIKNGRLAVTLLPSGSMNVYAYGQTGRACFVDDAGRLVVSIDGAEMWVGRIQVDLGPQIIGDNRIFILPTEPLSTELFWNGARMSKDDFVVIGNELITDFTPYRGNDLMAIIYK